MVGQETVIASVKEEAKKNLSRKEYCIYCSMLGNFRKLYEELTTECDIFSNSKEAKKLLAKLQRLHGKMKKIFKSKKIQNIVSECQRCINQIGHYGHKKAVYSDQVGATYCGCPAEWFTTSADDLDDIWTAQSMVNALFPR